MPAAALPDTLQRLRRQVEGIQGLEDISQEDQLIGLGLPDLDRALGGGLPRAALHDLAPAVSWQTGAAMGFALALAIRAREGAGRRPLLWLQTDFARREAGALYGPGFAQFGLPMRHLIVLRAARTIDALWATEEALRCGAACAVITELTDDVDLTTTRRLALAARDGNSTGFLLRHHSGRSISASATRWEIAGAPGVPDAYGGLGAPAFSLALLKNRRGACGRWTIRWDHHAHSFAPTLSLGMDAAARDRPDRAPALVRAG